MRVSELITYREFDRFAQETGGRHPIDVVNRVITRFPAALLGIRARTCEPDIQDRRLDHPVQFVTIQEALAYCEWRSQGGKVYRLPTRSEWEAHVEGGVDFPQIMEFLSDIPSRTVVCAMDFAPARRAEMIRLYGASVDGRPVRPYGLYWTYASSQEGVGFRVVQEKTVEPIEGDE